MSALNSRNEAYEDQDAYFQNVNLCNNNRNSLLGSSSYDKKQHTFES